MRGIFVVIFLTSFAVVYGKDSDELKAVVVLFRHGDRSPSKSWPKDPYINNENLFPDGLGQLNNFGKQRQYRLGQWFRERYEGFLPQRYNSSDIYVKSTDVDRTIMSAASNLAGLYPPESDQVWNKAINWQPIPIHTVPLGDDAILSSHVLCPKHDKLYEEFLNSPEVRQWEESLSDLYVNLSIATGYPIDELNVAKFGSIYGNIRIYKEYNLSLPDWTDTYWPQIKAWSPRKYQMNTWTQELARTRIGPFHDYLINYFVSLQNNVGSSPKLLMLSGHDTTLGDVMNSLGIYDDAAPEFASTMIWEVKNDYVNMYFKNSTHLESRTLSGCDSDCPIEQYAEIIKPIRVPFDQWTEECYSSNSV